MTKNNPAAIKIAAEDTIDGVAFTAEAVIEVADVAGWLDAARADAAALIVTRDVFTVSEAEEPLYAVIREAVASSKAAEDEARPLRSRARYQAKTRPTAPVVVRVAELDAILNANADRKAAAEAGLTAVHAEKDALRQASLTRVLWGVLEAFAPGSLITDHDGGHSLSITVEGRDASLVRIVGSTSYDALSFKVQAMAGTDPRWGYDADVSSPTARWSHEVKPASVNWGSFGSMTADDARAVLAVHAVAVDLTSALDAFYGLTTDWRALDAFYALTTD